MKLKTIVMTATTAAFMAACTTETIDEKVDALYEKMTQEERVSQLCAVYMNNLFDENDQLDTALCRKLIPNGIGHCSQFALNTRKTPDELRDMVAQMQDWLIHNTPSGIPALMHEEVLSGVNGMDATVYPQQIGLACSFNTELAELKTHQTAAALRKVGGMLALSPMVDVVRNPSFNRLEESYGEDGYLSAAMGTAFVRGLQHGDLRSGVAACTKHFLGYGGGGDADEKELMEEIIMPHEAIIRTEGSRALMPGYHDFRGTKCVANRELLQGILRDYLGFDGIVVSDYGAIEQVAAPQAPLRGDVTLPLGEGWGRALKAAAAINAGNDVDFPEGVSYSHLQEAIDHGLITQETLEKSVKRVLRLKAELGLLDENPKLYEAGHIEWDTPEERETAYKLATQSVVLLKNDGTLPLAAPLNPPLRGETQSAETAKSPSPKGEGRGGALFLTGPNANTMWAMLGDYTYNSMRFFWKQSIEDDQHPHIVGLKEGMENRLPEGFTLSYSRGCDWTEEVETVVDRSGDPRTSYMYKIQNRMIDSGEEANEREALALAAKADVIVAAVGENAILCGENRDRSHLRLPGRQEQYVEKLIATGKPVVLVIFGGRAQVISGLAERCAAVIQAWYPGEEGGNALADILYGNVSPSGKLSVTYPAEEIHEPICYNYGLNGDSRVAWPFGYGLSYTTFEYTNLRSITRPFNLQAKEEEVIEIALDIKNTGEVEADEVAQLYISPIGSQSQKQTTQNSKLRPIQLQGFKRLTLKPGETQTVTFRLSPQQFGHYMDGKWNVDEGRYLVKIGASSIDIRQQTEVVLKGGPLTMPHRTRFFAE